METISSQQDEDHRLSDDRDFASWMQRLQARFDENTENGKLPVFTTDAEGLFEAYLSGFSPADRQYHNCFACRRFFETYAGLVMIDEKGITQSAMFAVDDAPLHYRPSLTTMLRFVRRARVTGVHLSELRVWGEPETFDKKRGRTWHHFGLVNRAPYRAGVKTAFQAAAEKREEHHMVARALAEFSPEHVGQALQLLKSETLYRSEKVLGPVQWLADLHAARAAATGSTFRDNVLWRFVATAPAGFCHPRSSMAGTLLEDLAAGLPFDRVAQKFKAKMHPLSYQRPTAPPSAGTVQQAEELFAKLGLAPALRRRFARLDEIEAVWRPAAPATSKAGGLFGHLLEPTAPKGFGGVTPQVMTWEKFARTVLPSVSGLECMVPSHGNFCAFTTACDPEAPALLQWGNPFAWYVYHGGSHAQNWGLRADWCAVKAIALQPSLWGGRFEHHGKSITIMLDGARDVRGGGSLALFPECLRSELHGVRAVIEAYSGRGRLEQVEGPQACGLRLQAGQSWSVTLRATIAGVVQTVRLDRWD